MSTYKTSMDPLTKGVTIGITIVFAGLIVGRYSLINNAGRVDPVYTVVLLLSIYSIAFAFRPVNYKVSPDKLVITRLITDVHIPRTEITEVRLIDLRKLGPTVRTFGVSWLFGYFGDFFTFKKGKMTWYATRKNRTVLVTTSAGKKIILTPDDPDGFIHDMKS